MADRRRESFSGLNRAAPPAGRRSRYSRDPLGLRRAMADRLLPGLVGAMALLAVLAVAGARGADALAERWRTGAQAAVTVQVARPDAERMKRALAVLRGLPEVAEAQEVDPARMRELLRPWLGNSTDLPLPGVIEVRLADLSADPVLLGDKVALAVPGAVTEAHGIWVARMAALAAAVRGVALSVLLLVGCVAAAVVAVATRAGLSARRESILILHGLGATDGDIAGRFARRAAALAGWGAAGGVAFALPALVAMVGLARPLLAVGEAEELGWAAAVPWFDLILVPLFACAIGWATAQATVRLWLRRVA